MELNRKVIALKLLAQMPPARIAQDPVQLMKIRPARVPLVLMARAQVEHARRRRAVKKSVQLGLGLKRAVKHGRRARMVIAQVLERERRILAPNVTAAGSQSAPIAHRVPKGATGPIGVAPELVQPEPSPKRKDTKSGMVTGQGALMALDQAPPAARVELPRMLVSQLGREQRQERKVRRGTRKSPKTDDKPSNAREPVTAPGETRAECLNGTRTAVRINE